MRDDVVKTFLPGNAGMEQALSDDCVAVAAAVDAGGRARRQPGPRKQRHRADTCGAQPVGARTTSSVRRVSRFCCVVTIAIVLSHQWADHGDDTTISMSRLIWLDEVLGTRTLWSWPLAGAPPEAGGMSSIEGGRMSLRHPVR